jgi:hypothetical protein
MRSKQADYRRTLAITQSPSKNYDSNLRPTGDLRASLCSSKPLTRQKEFRFVTGSIESRSSLGLRSKHRSSQASTQSQVLLFVDTGVDGSWEHPSCRLILSQLVPYFNNFLKI